MVYVVLNAPADRLGTDDPRTYLAELFEKAGLDATIDADTERDLEQRIDAAVQSGAQTIVAAGGDGTVTAIASKLMGREQRLAIVPLGTANLLARDLDIPLEIEDAVAQLPEMVEMQIDAATMNGRFYLHKVVLGVVPDIAEAREDMRDDDRVGLLEFLNTFFQRLQRGPTMHLRLRVDEGEARSMRLRSIAVASNEYNEGFGEFFSRDDLTGGYLTVYMLRRMTPSDVFRLTISMLIGNWRHDPTLKMHKAQTVTIETDEPSAHLMIDGEVIDTPSPYTFAIQPKALRVLVPPAKKADVQRDGR